MKQVAIVTGGTRGIGRSISIKLALSGYKVYATYYIDEESARSLEEAHPNIITRRIDGRCLKQVEGLHDEILADSPPSILINNAGINNDVAFLTSTNESFQVIMDSNFGSTLNYCLAFSSRMAAAKFGNIVNVSSIASSKIKIGNTSYGCAKAAIDRLTLGLALELARFNVLVNAVSPGFVDTDMYKSFAGEKANDILRSIPGRKVMQPDEVADIILSLATRELNSTGSIIKVGNGENI